MSRLQREFFARDTREVARDLLGRRLVRVRDGKRIAGRIVEVEAYLGWEDAASHAYRGKTPRNAAMFGEAGISYVYFIYGMYWLLNVVAKPPDADHPAAILLRALEPVEGLDQLARYGNSRPEHQWTNGPGKLTRALDIDKHHDGLDLTLPDSPVFFETGEAIADERVATGPRIGVNVTEPWRSMPWRYWIKDCQYVSRK